MKLKEKNNGKAITDATFEAETKEGLVLVDFWATWCSVVCKDQSDKLSEELSEDVLKSLNGLMKIQIQRAYIMFILLFFQKDDKWLTSCWCSIAKIKAIVAELG
ncbi:MAG: thioredoxin family protein [Streptococcus sp.]